MTCDLERVYGALAAALPQCEPGAEDWDTLVLSRANVPRPPRSLRTDRIHVERGTHSYGSIVADHAYVSFRERATARHLGLAIVGTVLHRLPATAEIGLTVPGSDVVRLRVTYEHVAPDSAAASGHAYWARPEFVTYSPATAERHPDKPEGLGGVEARITTEDDDGVVVGHPDLAPPAEARDTLTGFGSAEASLWFATTLLDLGAPNAAENEVVLENDAGFGGVTLHGCELTLSTPGAAWWSGF